MALNGTLGTASKSQGAAGCVGVADDRTSIIEVTGVIKWFDPSKGYGFIVPDNGMPDILMHVSCLRRDGHNVAYKGARVAVQVLQRPSGLQVVRILAVDNSSAIYPAQMTTARTRIIVAPTSALERAQVKWFNRRRGFGFLTRGKDTPDIFVHAELLRHSGLTELRTGAHVSSVADRDRTV